MLTERKRGQSTLSPFFAEMASIAGGDSSARLITVPYVLFSQLLAVSVGHANLACRAWQAGNTERGIDTTCPCAQFGTVDNRALRALFQSTYIQEMLELEFREAVSERLRPRPQ